jgi:hypothetical protein
LLITLAERQRIRRVVLESAGGEVVSLLIVDSGGWIRTLIQMSLGD